MKNIFEIESEIGEARGDYIRSILGNVTDISALRAANANLVKSFDDVLKYAKQETKPIMGKLDAKSKTVSELTTVDDLAKALSKNGGGLSRNSVGQFYKGLMKSPYTDVDIIKSIAPDLVGNSKFRDTYSKFATEAELIAELKKKQYSKAAIKEIVAATKKDADFINARAKFTGGGTGPTPAPGPGPGPGPGPLPRNWKETIKNWPWKKIGLWAAGLGIPSIVIYNMLFGTEYAPDDLPKDKPKKSEGFPPCVAELIDSNKATISETNGKYYALIKTPKYPSGLKFFIDGNVINVKTGETTVYNCK
jgi:hypothetical protein